jgi:hypothetical protein
MKSSLRISLVIFLFVFAVPSISLASASVGTIDATNRYAWGENIGWVDFGSAGGNVTIEDDGLSGYAYGENIGWVLLDDVTNDGEGVLGGYGWSENAGWIDFSHVTIDSDGIFSGYAYGENIGNIVFGSVDNLVTTDWRHASSRVVAPVSTPTPSASRSGSHRRSVPTTPLVQTTVVPMSTTTIASTSTIFSSNLKMGMYSPSTKKLQEYLNSHGFAVSSSGAGSPGRETMYFGPATRAALAKFQKANGISPAVGFFGPITRAFINSHY